MSQLNLADIITANEDPEEIFEILDLLGMSLNNNDKKN
jgi:hypothetical protein